MTPREPAQLPVPLRQRSFTVSEALALGLNRHRLAAGDLRRPYRGIRLPAPAEAPHSEQLPRSVALRAEVLRQAHAYLPLMKPGMAFSHLSAAVIWNLPLPLGLVLGEQMPSHLEVSARPSLSRPRHQGIRAHVLPAEAHITVVDGLPVCDALTVWRMLAGHPAYTDADLVAIGDHLACRAALRSDQLWPVVSPAELIGWAHGLTGRHCRRMRHVAGLVRDGAQSPMESLIRMLLIDSGLPEPELNVDVHDAQGRFVARLDMLYRHARVAPEFDGDQHRTSRVQYERDRERLRALRVTGYDVIQADLKTLIVPARANRFVAEVRDALGRGAPSVQKSGLSEWW